MRLTNTIRDAFVRAAMDDVPSVDYQEEIYKVVLADAVAQLPAKIKTIYNDKELSGFIRTDSAYAGDRYVYVPTSGRYKQSTTCEATIAELQAKKDVQDDERSSLRQRLRGCAYACTTRKALVEMLPEFEEYLPADEAAACRTLPVVANVVAEFVKAGWPKGGKEKVAK